MEKYPPELEERMRCFYYSFNEKERRLYTGLGALRIGHGGRNYIASVLGCSRNTVSKGAFEISDLPRKEGKYSAIPYLSVNGVRLELNSASVKQLNRIVE